MLARRGESARVRRERAPTCDVQRRCALSVFVAHFRVPSVCDVFSLCGACAEGAAAGAAASVGDGSVCLRAEGLRGLLSGEGLRLPGMSAHKLTWLGQARGASSTQPPSTGGACRGQQGELSARTFCLLETTAFVPGKGCGGGRRGRGCGGGLRARGCGGGLRAKGCGGGLRAKGCGGGLQVRGCGGGLRARGCGGVRQERGCGGDQQRGCGGGRRATGCAFARGSEKRGRQERGCGGGRQERGCGGGSCSCSCSYSGEMRICAARDFSCRHQAAGATRCAGLSRRVRPRVPAGRGAPAR